MTDDQIDLGRHALGLPNRKRISYRNHFCAGPGHLDYFNWLEMTTLGYAIRRKGSELSGGDDVFLLTFKGASECVLPGEKLCAEDFPEVLKP